jgi:hypothetical protein
VTPDEERRHVEGGPRRGERTDELVVVVAARAGDPNLVLQNAREVMLAVLDHPGSPWPSLDGWRGQLPQWFVDRCAPEMSTDEAAEWLAQWRSLPPAERAEEERNRSWSLGDWLYWLEPEHREWLWWDAVVTNGTVNITVQVSGWPAPLGALDWLLRAAGATEVTVDPLP